MTTSSRDDGKRSAAVRLALIVLLAVAGLAVAPAPSATAGPTGGTLGIDVANYQHPNGAPINWAAVRGAGYRFAVIKATEGPSNVGGYYTNPYFASDFAQAGGAGLYRGAYHFARPQLPLDSAVAQARYFVSVTGTMRSSIDLPPVLDLESTGGLGRSDLQAWTQSWLNEVEHLTGRRPIIYTGYYFWNDNVASSAFGGYRLWMARYTSAPDPTPLPSSWSTWTMWQYSSSGQVPGIAGNVDLNVYCCGDGNLAALADGASSSANAGNPFGSLDTATRVPGGIAVNGWAIDPDTTGPVSVHAYVDGHIAKVATAGTSRPDVGAGYPGWSAAHGFSFVAPSGPGDHQVCVFAINTGSGSANPSVGCRTVVGTPVGSLDEVSAAGPGALAVRGWTIDPDVAGPIETHLYVDGRGAAVLIADASRADIAAAYPPFGGAHGYTATLAGLTPGAHRVCAFAINVGSGAGNPSLGCRTATVFGADPVGAFDTIDGRQDRATVRGWVIDPDAPSAAVAVQVTVDGTVRTTVPASAPRLDVGYAYPVFGAAHGYEITVDGLAGGNHTVCLTAVNVVATPGASVSLGCKVLRMAGDPFGSLDSVTRSGLTATVQGWAIDPDRTGPIEVHVYVNGGGHVLVAGASRPDVGQAYPAYGSGHGFAAAIPGLGAKVGASQVCAFAINVATGTANTTLGCVNV